MTPPLIEFAISRLFQSIGKKCLMKAAAQIDYGLNSIGLTTRVFPTKQVHHHHQPKTTLGVTG